MKKAIGGLAVLLILGLVFTGCSNPAGSSRNGELPAKETLNAYGGVSGLPVVDVSGHTGYGGRPTADVKNGDVDDVVLTGNSAWEMAMRFTGNRELTKDIETIIRTPIRKQIPVYERIPVFAQIPVYDKVPVYEQLPLYEQKPVYEQIPVREQIPVFIKVPNFAWDPVTKEYKVMVKEPVYGMLPVYPQKAVWGEVPRVIDVETWVPVYAGADSAWAGWVTDDVTFPHNASGFEKDGVVRTGQTAWAMAVAYEGVSKEVLLVQGQHRAVGTVSLEAVDSSSVRVTLNLGDNQLSEFHLGYYYSLGGFNVGNGQLNGNKLINGLSALVPYDGGKLYIGVHTKVKERLSDKKVIVQETVMVDEIIGWVDDTDQEPIGWVENPDDIVGWADTDVVDYTVEKVVGYKPVITGYRDVRIGYKNGDIIGYIDGKQIGTEDDLSKPTGEYRDGEFLGYENGEVLYYEDGDIIDWARGEIIRYRNGKIIGWKLDVQVVQERFEAPAVFDLIAGQHIKAGEVTLFDDGEGKLTVTYLFYNGADPKVIHAGAWASIDQVPNGPGQYPVNIKNPVLNEDRTFSVTVPYTSGSSVYVVAHCGF